MGVCQNKKHRELITSTLRWIITNIQLGTLCIRFCECIFVDHRNGNEAEGGYRQVNLQWTYMVYPEMAYRLITVRPVRNISTRKFYWYQPFTSCKHFRWNWRWNISRVKLSDVHFQHHVLCEIILDAILDRCSPINFPNWLEMLELSQKPFPSWIKSNERWDHENSIISSENSEIFNIVDGLSFHCVLML